MTTLFLALVRAVYRCLSSSHSKTSGQASLARRKAPLSPGSTSTYTHSPFMHLEEELWHVLYHQAWFNAAGTLLPGLQPVQHVVAMLSSRSSVHVHNSWPDSQRPGDVDIVQTTYIANQQPSGLDMEPSCPKGPGILANA